MKKTFIYTLSDPITEEVRYVGKANNIKNRYNGHLIDKSFTYKANWIKSLLNKGLKPEIEIIDEVLESEWKYWEVFYINLYKSWGFNLTNSTEGGDGIGGEVKYKIIQYSKEGKFIKIFNSVKDAAEELNTNVESIRGGLFKDCIRKGYKWEVYKDNYLLQLPIKQQQIKEKPIETKKEKIKRTLIKEHKLKLKLAHSTPVIAKSIDNSNKDLLFDCMFDIRKQWGLSYDKIKKHIKSNIPLNGYVLSFQDKFKPIKYPSNRSSKPKIELKIYQLNRFNKVINIWDNAVEIYRNHFKETTETIGNFHHTCRLKGKRSWKGYFWVYEKDLSKSYKVNDIVKEVNLSVKTKEVYVYENNNIINTFSSIKSAADYFKVSEPTIKNYINQHKLISNNYILTHEKI